MRLIPTAQDEEIMKDIENHPRDQTEVDQGV